MGLNTITIRGKRRLQVSKRWPDGTRFRRIVPNRTIGKQVLARLEEAIAMGTWSQLRDELGRPPEEILTIDRLADLYLEHAKRVNRRPDFKRLTLVAIRRHLGGIRLPDFRRSHGWEFIERRSREGVAPATINRGLAVLKNMMTFALEKEWIPTHPLIRFPLLREPQRALRVLTLEEERRLIEAVACEDPTIGALCALLGETGFRLSEGLRLRWEHLRLGERIATAAETKSGKVRHVPLTGFALEWIRTLDRVVGIPYVFLRGGGRPWRRRPRGPFERGRRQAGLEWCGYHDLRHFRATEWVKYGVDLRTVQELLGHADLTTTMRYAHFAPSHALRSVRRVERLEREKMELDRPTSGQPGR